MWTAIAKGYLRHQYDFGGSLGLSLFWEWFPQFPADGDKGHW